MKPCTAEAEVHKESHELLLLPKATPSSTVAHLWCAFRATSEVEPNQALTVQCLCDARSLGEAEKVEEPPLPAQRETTNPTAAWAANSRIRRMAAEDLDPVISVENICFMEPYSRDTFEAILQHQSYTTYLAETSAGRSAGYLTLELPGDCQGYVMSLAVLPVFRCRGVAQQLLQHAMWEAFQGGVKMVKLHVHTQNVGAIRLYRRCGFEILSEASDFYGSGDDLQCGNAYLMGCSLAPQDEAK